MYVHKAGNNGFPFGDDLTRATRHGHLSSWTYGGNASPVNDHNGIGDIFEWGESAVGVDGDRQH
jgi:hypothetical protein